ncbi:hypothetical protein LARV_01557 [Longilinea arvoryzae]|uniref:Uncharacterized protein n=1 Tax=Longilinea arvoryzae TaxID=360412 RepID=A0A0S7BJH9_9CHLR|nr:hypothetical protein LARV_01557 [Longilinea arvoryzae]
MAVKMWEPIKVQYCDHAGCEVALEAEVVYPAETLPDQPRLGAHRCSHGAICSQMDKPACLWAGTNPGYDPFNERSFVMTTEPQSSHRG